MAFDQVEIHSINRASGVYSIRLNFDDNRKWISTGTKTRVSSQGCLMSTNTFTSSRVTEELANALGTLKIEISDHPGLVYDDGTGNFIRECFEQAIANGYLVHAIVARHDNSNPPVFQEFVFNGSFDPREMTIAHRHVPPNDRRTETISCEFTPAKRLDSPLSTIVWQQSDLESVVRPVWLCIVGEPGVDGYLKTTRTNPDQLSVAVITGEERRYNAGVGGWTVTGTVDPGALTHDLAYGSNPYSTNTDITVVDPVGNGTTVLSSAGFAYPAGNWMIKLTSAIDKIFTACDIIWDGVIPPGLQARWSHYNYAANIYVDDGEVNYANLYIHWNYTFGFNPYDGRSFKGPGTFDGALLCRDFLKAIAAQVKSRIDIYGYNSDGLPMARFVTFGQTFGAFPALERMPESNEDAFITDKDGVRVKRRGFDGSVIAPANAVNPVEIEIPFAPYAIGYETYPPYDASRLTPNPTLEFQDQWKCGHRGSISPGGESQTQYPLNPDGGIVGMHLFGYDPTTAILHFPALHDDAGHDGDNESFYQAGGWAGYYPVHAIYDIDPEGTPGLTNDEKKDRQKNFLISYALFFGRHIRGQRRQLVIQFRGCVAPNWSDIANGMTYNFQPLTTDVEYSAVSIERDISGDFITVHFEEVSPDTLSITYKIDGDQKGNGSIDGGGSTKGTNPPDLSSTGAVIVNPPTAHRNKIKPTVTGVAALEIEGFDTATTGELQFLEATANGTSAVKLKAPAALATDVSLTLPAVQGAENTLMRDDGTGILSFITLGSLLVGGTGIALSEDIHHKVTIDCTVGGMAIGNPVGGSSANAVLFIDASGNLGQDAGDFTYSPNSGNPALLLAGGVNTSLQINGSGSSHSILKPTQLQLMNTSGFATNIFVSSSTAATWSLTLPVNAGTSGYLLKTDGAGVTSWVDPLSSLSGLGTGVVVSNASVISTNTLAATSILYGTNTHAIKGNSDLLTFIDSATPPTLKLGKTTQGTLFQRFFTDGQLIDSQTSDTAAHSRSVYPDTNSVAGAATVTMHGIASATNAQYTYRGILHFRQSNGGNINKAGFVEFFGSFYNIGGTVTDNGLGLGNTQQGGCSITPTVSAAVAGTTYNIQVASTLGNNFELRTFIEVFAM